MLMEMMKGIGSDGWFAHHSHVTSDAVAMAHAYGLCLSTWTVNEPIEMHRLMGLGIEAICTDYPDVLFAECTPTGFANS
jgi:glycerophosphoryl diester phosphodiesterase